MPAFKNCCLSLTTVALLVLSCAHEKHVTSTAREQAPDLTTNFPDIAPPAPPPGAVAADPEPEPEVFAFSPVYFDFNVSEIRPDQRAALLEAVPHLGAPTVLAGHCDERGTTSYNLALGQRRADAVRKYLVAHGVDGALLGTVSYGEERAQGHDEAGWAQDRKVTFGQER